MDGDGRGDLVIGAPHDGPNPSAPEAGRAYVFSRGAGGILHELVSPNEQEDGNFGISVADAGDYDGDGRHDVLVGAPSEGPPPSPSRAGRAYLFSGADGALLLELHSPDQESGGGFGRAVAGVGDVDGDGRGELLVGTSGERRAYVFSGATGALLHTLAAPDPGPYSRFGNAVAGLDDIDGDGFSDMLIGDPEEGAILVSGRAFVFSGATGELVHQLDSPDPEEFGYFGYAVSGVPDLDGDGRGDLLVGAMREGNGGRVYVLSGGTGTLLYPVTSPNPWPYGGQFGIAVSGVPDVDGDGRGDYLVGAPTERIASWSEDYIGRAYLFSGAGGAPLYTFAAPEERHEAEFGSAVSLAVDADGARRDAMLIGACGEGRAYLYRTELVGTGVVDEEASVFAFDPPYPNPVKGEATLAVTLAASAHVRVSVHDTLGREVAVLTDRMRGAGRHEVAFDGSVLPAGVYVVRLVADREGAARVLTVSR